MQQKRLFHILTAFITTIAFLSYYAMATGTGIGIHTTVIRETKLHVITELVKRQVFWVRYIDVSSLFLSASHPSDPPPPAPERHSKLTTITGEVVSNHSPSPPRPLAHRRHQRREHPRARVHGCGHDPIRPLRRALARQSTGLGLVRVRVSRVPQHRLPDRLQGTPRRDDQGHEDKGVFRRHLALHIGSLDSLSHVSFSYS